MNTIAVVTPTIGRDTLARTVESVQKCLSPQDRHIIVYDTLHDEQEIGIFASAPGSPHIYNERFASPGSMMGNGQRDFAIELILKMDPRPTFIVFIDDDDILLPEAAEALRAAEPSEPHVFGMRWGADGAELYAGSFELGSVGGPQCVWPTSMSPMPKWMDTNQYGSDWHCIREILKQFPSPNLHSEVICEVRPRG